MLWMPADSDECGEVEAGETDHYCASAG